MYFKYFKHRFFKFLKTPNNISIFILISKLLALPLKIDVTPATCKKVTSRISWYAQVSVLSYTVYINHYDNFYFWMIDSLVVSCFFVHSNHCRHNPETLDRHLCVIRVLIYYTESLTSRRLPLLVHEFKCWFGIVPF